MEPGECGRNTVCTLAACFLGSQLPGNRVKELESGADGTDRGVPVNRQCHGAHCVRHLKKPLGCAFRRVGVLVDSEKEHPSPLCADLTVQHNTTVCSF